MDETFLPRIKRLGHGPQTRLALAVALVEQGDAAAAMAECQAVLRWSDRYALAHFVLAGIYSDLGRYDEALTSSARALAFDQGITEAHRLRSYILAETGHYPEALAERQAALALDPENALDHHRLGELQLAMGQNKAALASFREAARLNPQMAVAYFGIANAHLRHEEEEAIAALETALRISPGFPKAHLLLGDIAASRGDHGGAIRHYRDALSLNQRQAEPHFRLGELHFHLGRFPTALVEYRLALVIKPRYAPAHHRLGNVYFRLGHYDLAIRQYEAALTHNPNLAAARADTGDALLALGRWQEAIDHYRRALAQVDLACPEGETALGEERFLEAIRAFRGRLGLDPALIVPAAVEGGGLPPETLGHDERRADQRLALAMPVDVRARPGSYLGATLVNVSKHGLLLDSPEPVALGSEIEVITGLELGGQKLAARGRIVRQEDWTAGLPYRYGVALLERNEAWEQYLAETA
ncbi:MAG: tetratricopeptide repeat protein [Thermodesulfobacteriota bacterium]